MSTGPSRHNAFQLHNLTMPKMAAIIHDICLDGDCTLGRAVWCACMAWNLSTGTYKSNITREAIIA